MIVLPTALGDGSLDRRTRFAADVMIIDWAVQMTWDGAYGTDNPVAVNGCPSAVRVLVRQTGSASVGTLGWRS